MTNPYLHLFNFCVNGNLKKLKENLRALSKVEVEAIRDDNGASLAHYAARNGFLEILQYLLFEKKISPYLTSNVGASLLHDATVKGRLDIIEWLIESTKLSLTTKDNSGSTIVHIAAKFNQTTVLEWIISKNGPKSVIVQTYNAATCLHFACLTKSLASLKVILDAAPNLINIQMNNGVTPLYLAVQNNDMVMTKYLIHFGANISIKAEDGMNVLHVASQNGSLEMVKLLVEQYSMDLNEKDYTDSTCLHFACARGNSTLVAYMLDNMAQITTDKSGSSPLHECAVGGFLECARLLISNGCDPLLRNIQNKTCADICFDNGYLLMGKEMRMFENKYKMKNDILDFSSFNENSFYDNNIKQYAVAVAQQFNDDYYYNNLSAQLRRANNIYNDLEKANATAKVFVQSPIPAAVTHLLPMSATTSKAPASPASVYQQLDEENYVVISSDPAKKTEKQQSTSKLSRQSSSSSSKKPLATTNDDLANAILKQTELKISENIRLINIVLNDDENNKVEATTTTINNNNIFVLDKSGHVIEDSSLRTSSLLEIVPSESQPTSPSAASTSSSDRLKSSIEYVSEKHFVIEHAHGYNRVPNPPPFPPPALLAATSPFWQISSTKTSTYVSSPSLSVKRQETTVHSKGYMDELQSLLKSQNVLLKKSSSDYKVVEHVQPPLSPNEENNNDKINKSHMSQLNLRSNNNSISPVANNNKYKYRPAVAVAQIPEWKKQLIEKKKQKENESSTSDKNNVHIEILNSSSDNYVPEWKKIAKKKKPRPLYTYD